MMRRLALFLIVSGLSAAAERPNILFILADDMGWQDTSVPFAKDRIKFNDRFQTPALERLAREGMEVHPGLFLRGVFTHTGESSHRTEPRRVMA